MHLPEYHSFPVTGYDAYCEDVLPELGLILGRTLGDREGHFLTAVSEAACNAARYALGDPSEAEIEISLLVNEGDIKATVAAATHPFDAAGLRHRLRSLAEDKEWREMDWGDYKGAKGGGRGFFLMLMASEFVVVDTRGQSVTLSAKRPFAPSHIKKRIKDLAARLLLSKDGVIF